MKQNVLIWLRRFRPRYGRRVRFHAALAQACSGLAYPITIQDSSYRASFIDSITGRAWFVIPILFLVFIVVMVVDLLVFYLLSFGSGLVVVAVSIELAIVLAITLKVYRRLGYRSYQGPDALLRVRTRLESIKSGKHGSVLGVEVMQCDDEVWQLCGNRGAICGGHSTDRHL